MDHYLQKITIVLLAASVEACKRNIAFNGSAAAAKVDSELADAQVYMLTHPNEFDMVSFCYLSCIMQPPRPLYICSTFSSSQHTYNFNLLNTSK